MSSHKIKGNTKGKVPSMGGNHNRVTKLPSEYQSAHTKMALMKSSFTPQKGWKVAEGLINEQMIFHRKRVESAKTRVDSSQPTSMTHSTLWRNRNRTKLNNMNTSLSKHATENSRVSRLDKCVQFNFGVSSTDVGAGNMDECVHINGQEDARMGPDTQQWDNVTRQPPPVDHVRSPYITKTAGKMVLHKERISAKSGSSHSEREQIPPWKPAAASKDKHKGFIGFSESSLPTDPLRLSNGQNTPGTYENGIVNNRPTLRVTKTTGSVLDQIPTPNGKVGTETITLNKARTSPNTQTRTIVLHQSDDSREHHFCENENYSNDEFEDDSCESVTPMMSSEDEQQGKFPSTPSEVEATEHTPHVGVHKGTSLVSHLPPGLSSNELQYLSFVSTITKDVIARGVYTDVGLNMLFAEHIERNRDRLNLGEMNKRVQELRDKLNIKIN